MRKIITRIENAEKKTGGGQAPVDGIFISIVDGDGSDVPVDGWRLQHDGPEVWRLDGESDQDLQARAKSMATTTPAVFIQLCRGSSHDEN